MKEKGFTPVIILFIIGLTIVSGIAGYSLGQRSITKPLPPQTENSDKANQAKLADYESKLSRLTKLDNVGSFSPSNGTKITFKCYASDKLPNDPKISKIKQELNNDKRLIDDICSGPENKNFIVNTYTLKDDSKKIGQRIDFDKFNESDFFTTEFLYQPEIPKSEVRYFKLNSWLSNNDIVFSLIQWPTGGLSGGTIMTYYKSADFRSPSEIDPKLIEYCNWGIGGGTSARYINSCTRFTTNKESLYLQGKDLP